jgi:hypothetical protein
MRMWMSTGRHQHRSYNDSKLKQTSLKVTKQEQAPRNHLATYAHKSVWNLRTTSPA